MSFTQSPHFLRAALAADAVASGATGLLMIAGAGLLTGLLHIPADWLTAAGLVLVPYVAFVIYVATRPVLPRAAVHAIVEINFVWTIASFIVLFGGFFTPNLLGTLFIAGQALAVFALGVAQYVGLRATARTA